MERLSDRPEVRAATRVIDTQNSGAGLTDGSRAEPSRAAVTSRVFRMQRRLGRGPRGSRAWAPEGGPTQNP